MTLRSTPTKTIIAAWHEKHPMPERPTTEQRIRWHVQHQRHCNCRPIPAELLDEIERRLRDGNGSELLIATSAASL